MVNTLDRSNEVKLHSNYNFHFRTNTFGKGINLLIRPAMG